MARLKEKRRVSLKKERIRNYKEISNVLIIISRDIMPGITIPNRNRIKELE
jgi:hypothetical protein